MERIIRYGNILNDPLYNCSARTPDLVEKAHADPYQVYGLGCIIIGSITLILFMLCIKVMLEPPHIEYPTYKIMVVISFYDMCGVSYSSIACGRLYYYGISFCDSPMFVYITGSIGASAWVTSSMLSSILIINRLVELSGTQNYLLINIFNGKYTLLILFIPICTGLYCFIFEYTIILELKSGLAFWDPQIHKNASYQYFSPVMTMNDIFVVSFNTISSIFLCFSISKHLRENLGSMIDRRRQITLFFQCLAIVSVSNIASIIYVLPTFFDCSLFVQQLGGILYQLATILPPYIYLILNRSIRHGFLKIFLGNTYNVDLITSTKTTTSTPHRRLELSTSHFNAVVPIRSISPPARA